MVALLLLVVVSDSPLLLVFAKSARLKGAAYAMAAKSGFRRQRDPFTLQQFPALEMLMLRKGYIVQKLVFLDIASSPCTHVQGGQMYLPSKAQLLLITVTCRLQAHKNQ
eukprot:749098-Amphidinium_carterae.1